MTRANLYATIINDSTHYAGRLYVQIAESPGAKPVLTICFEYGENNNINVGWDRSYPEHISPTKKRRISRYMDFAWQSVECSADTAGVFTEEQLKFLNLYAHHYNNGADYVIV